MCYERLLNAKAADKASPTTLFEAAYAYKMANYTVKKEEIAKQLLARGTSLKIGWANLATSRSCSNRSTACSAPASIFAWPTIPWVVVLPLAARKASAARPSWRSAPAAEVVKQRHAVQKHRKQADSSLHRRQPVIPANQPVTVTLNDEHGAAKPLLVYRSFLGINAVEMKTGKLVWGTPSKWSLESMLGDSKHASAIKSWLQFYVSPNGRPSLLYENSTVGTLSTDGTYVYAVEDWPCRRPRTFK